jgi:nitroreductase
MKKLLFFCLIIFLFSCYNTNKDKLKQQSENYKNKDLIIFHQNSDYILKFASAAFECYITKKNSNDIDIFNPNIDNVSLPNDAIDVVFNNYPEKNFLNVIFNRTSCRHFKDGKDISDADIELILRGAMSSPSGFDKRSWSFITVKNKETMRTLLNPTIVDEKRDDGFTGAKVMFIVCVDPSVSKGYFFDAALSSLNLMLTAEYLNYASCWIDIFPHQKRIELIRKELKIPKLIVPFNMVVIGYSNEERRPKNKFDLNKIHNEFWNNPQKSNIGKNKFINLN